MAADDGDGRVIATAQHIVRTLGTNENVTEDMLRILSNFDDRFSIMNERVPTNRSPDLSSVSQGNEDLQRILIRLEEIAMKWDGRSSEVSRRSTIWQRQPQDLALYLQAVDEVQRLIGSLSISWNCGPVLDRARNVHKLAMARLQEEFGKLISLHSEAVDSQWLFAAVSGLMIHPNGEGDTADLESHSSSDSEDAGDIPLANPVTDLNLTCNLLSPESVSDLNDIAKRMVAGGYARECCQIYANVRKPVLEQNLYRLGLEKLTMEDVQKLTWEIMERRIKRWIQCFRVSVKVLFPSERKLSDGVFSGLSPWRETCFTDVAKGLITQLLSLGQNVAIGRRSPEKLFKILDMYETFLNLLPDLDSVFSGELFWNVRSEANAILTQLGEAAQGTFIEFEKAIRCDKSTVPVPGGNIHPATRYVMNYIRFLLDYTDTLKQLFRHRRKDAPNMMGMEMNDLADSVGDKAIATSPLAVRIIRLTVLLERNLDEKSELYKDYAQAHLFLMNNAHYVVQKAKQSELVTLLGESWARKQTERVQQYGTNYLNASWMKVLAYLREGGLSVSGNLPSNDKRGYLMERLKCFNSAFEEMHRTQSLWVVPDTQLREGLQNSIADMLIPAYRSFLHLYLNWVDTGGRPEKYIKFSPDDIRNYLMDFFEGTSASVTHHTKTFSTS
eukprot:c26506_g1_i1 orf=292-2301(-)